MYHEIGEMLTIIREMLNEKQDTRVMVSCGSYDSTTRNIMDATYDDEILEILYEEGATIIPKEKIISYDLLGTEDGAKELRIYIGKNQEKKAEQFLSILF